MGRERRGLGPEPAEGANIYTSLEGQAEEKASLGWGRSGAEGRAGTEVRGLLSNPRNAHANRRGHHVTPMSLAQIRRHYDAKCAGYV